MTIKFTDDDLTAKVTTEHDDTFLYFDDWDDDEVLVTIERDGYVTPGVRISVDDLIEVAANFAGR